jgi:hypothetical protein
VEHEVFESCGALERETGRAPIVFAYPNGRPQDFDERTKAALRRRGVRWALAATRGLAHRNSDPLALPRIMIWNGLSFAGFRLVVSGALSWRHGGFVGRLEGAPPSRPRSRYSCRVLGLTPFGLVVLGNRIPGLPQIPA